MDCRVKPGNDERGSSAFLFGNRARGHGSFTIPL
jgi:hypothetical protein